MNSESNALPIPAGPGSVAGAPGLPSGFTVTLRSRYVDRDLSLWARPLVWALMALIVFGIVAIFVSIPKSNIIYAVAGLVIFGGFRIFDFNRLRCSTPDVVVPIAAAIFLDVFNIFLIGAELFGGRRDPA